MITEPLAPSHDPNRPPSRERFFAPLEVVLDPGEFERVQAAYELSKAGHAKQVRDDGTRYFDHPKSTAWIYINELGGRDPDVIIMLLLHDIPEDTFLLSFYRIRVNFGVVTATRVRAMTKMNKESETFEENIDRIIAVDVEAVLGKLLDRLHNLRTLCNCSVEKQKRKIKESKEIVLPRLLAKLRSYGGQYVMYADHIEREAKKAMDAVTKSWEE
jgi:(p)ppGpp synthase/HD superfamily hydrolase